MNISLILSVLLVAYPPAKVEVDVRPIAPFKTDTSQQLLRSHYLTVYPDVVEVLHRAGLPIVAPQNAEDLGILTERGIVFTEALESSPRVRVEIYSPELNPPSYRISIEVLRQDGTRTPFPVITCETECFYPDIGPLVAEHATEILALLTVPVEPLSEGSSVALDRPPVPAEAEPDPSVSPSDTDPKRPPRFSPILGAGIAAGSLGLAFMAWGGASYLRDARSEWQVAPAWTSEERRNYANATTNAVFWTGTAVLAAGLVLIGTELALRKRTRSRSGSVAASRRDRWRQFGRF